MCRRGAAVARLTHGVARLLARHAIHSRWGRGFKRDCRRLCLEAGRACARRSEETIASGKRLNHTVGLAFRRQLCRLSKVPRGLIVAPAYAVAQHLRRDVVLVRICFRRTKCNPRRTRTTYLPEASQLSRPAAFTRALGRGSNIDQARFASGRPPSAFRVSSRPQPPRFRNGLATKLWPLRSHPIPWLRRCAHNVCT